MDALKIEKENILMYHGPMNINLLSFVGNYIKDWVDSVDYRIITRIYKIFIELAQNVSYYSAEKRKSVSGRHAGIGWFKIKEMDDYFTISTGNIIKATDGPILEDYCKEINGLNEEQLRELKRQTRGKASIKDVGAHIGLIQTSILSGNSIDYTIDVGNNTNACFIIHVKVVKN